MMEEGRYWGEYREAGLSVAKTGNEQCWIDVIVTHILRDGVAESDAEPLPVPQVRTIFWSLSPQAWPYTADKLDALGFNGNFQEPEFRAFAEFGGCWVYCRYEEWQGRPRERWDLQHRSERKPVANDVIRSLNARWKADRAKVKPVKKAPATPATATKATRDEVGWEAPATDGPPPAPPAGDDIPF